MRTLEQRFEDADRLASITQRIGFALWQIQELEGASAQYFVLVTQARRGMGAGAGDLLLAKAQRNTFGTTLRRIADAGLLDAELGERLRSLLHERNWLVHKSRVENRSAVYADAIAGNLMARVDRIAEESNALLKRIGALAERHVLQQGISVQQIDEMAARLMNEWHEADSI